MALLAHQQIAATGTAVSFASAAAAGDTVAPDSRLFLWVKNTNASARTVTVAVPGTYYGQALGDIAVSVPATTGERLIGPLDNRLADGTTGLVNITYSSEVGVTVAAVKV